MADNRDDEALARDMRIASQLVRKYEEEAQASAQRQREMEAIITDLEERLRSRERTYEKAVAVVNAASWRRPSEKPPRDSKLFIMVYHENGYSYIATADELLPVLNTFVAWRPIIDGIDTFEGWTEGT